MLISDCTVKANKIQSVDVAKLLNMIITNGRKNWFWTIFLFALFLTADAPFKKCTQQHHMRICHFSVLASYPLLNHFSKCDLHYGTFDSNYAFKNTSMSHRKALYVMSPGSVGRAQAYGRMSESEHLQHLQPPTSIISRTEGNCHFSFSSVAVNMLYSLADYSSRCRTWQMLSISKENTILLPVKFLSWRCFLTHMQIFLF